MKSEKKLWIIVKVISFAIALIVAIDAFKEGYKFFEVVFLTLITFFGAMISLLLALSEKERRYKKNYEEERNRYLYQEKNPNDRQL